MMLDSATSSLPSQHLIELGFAIALAATLWRRHWGLAVFLALALVEAHQNQRYAFHAWVRDMLLGVRPDGVHKHLMQSNMAYTAFMLGLAVLVLLTPMLLRAAAGRRLMVAGVTVVVAMLATELISQHDVDALIYHRKGPFALAAIAYFIGASTIACGALMTPSRTRRSGPARAPRRADGNA